MGLYINLHRADRLNNRHCRALYGTDVYPLIVAVKGIALSPPVLLQLRNKPKNAIGRNSNEIPRDTDHRFRTGRCLKHAVVMIAAIMAVASAIVTIGCATIMVATAGPPKPDLEKIQVGVSQQAVEAELGNPIALKFNVSVYKFNSSDPPPWHAGLVIDAVTFGTGFICLDAMYNAFHKDKEKLGAIYGPQETVIGASYPRAESDYMD